MAEMLKPQKIRAALVFQAVQLGQHLRIALAEAGIEVVAESQANALSSSGFDESLDVFVVNLDPELEDHLDEVSDLLDRYERPVIFNDGAASSGLAGWDQARWARHLASKIRGELDSHPPRPKDATYIPQPAIPQPAIPQNSRPVQPVQGLVKPRQSELAPAPAPVVQQQQPVPQKPMSATVELPKMVMTPLANFSKIESKDAPAIDSPVVSSSEDEASAFDFKDPSFAWDELDALPAGGVSGLKNTDEIAPDLFDLPDFELALEPMADASDDFETLLRTQQNEKSVNTLAISPVSVVAAATARPAPIAAETPKEAKMDWSLEPFDSDEVGASTAPITGRASYSAKDIATPVIALKPTASAALPAAPPASVVLEELSDLDFFTEMDDLPASTTLSSAPQQSPNSLDQLFADLDDISFDASGPINSAPSSSEPSSSDPGLTSSFVDDFDFDMDIESTLNLPVSKVGAQTKELPVFDARFSNSANVELSSATDLAYAGPSRVYVLGASIGGPEAVKTFLSKLKPGIAAAFVLAQHMGAEFLELMAGQLSKSSVLPVKLAQEGVALLEAEVVVVPVNKRFMVDAHGKVEFQEIFDESPYSPSIDQVMSDMSERFGSRCVGIIFSGMASDAIEGSTIIASRGGKIWVQDPATCVISSMIDGAQAAGVVSYVGTPEQLADHVLEDIGVR